MLSCRKSRSLNTSRGRLLRPRLIGVGAAISCCLIMLPSSARCETIASALAKAYRDNPELGEQRANVRVRDEDVSRAAAGMRPRAGVSINGGAQLSHVRQPAGRGPNYDRVFADDRMFGYPRGGSIGVSQPVFDGWRTDNSLRQAESGVLAAREEMRRAEQETLLNAATAYMNVLRDAAVLTLRKSNIAVLNEQLRVTHDRLEVGEVTVTDLAQAQASLAQARSNVFAAQGALDASIAAYERVIGETPRRLEPPASIEHILPKTREVAVESAMVKSPAIAAALHQIDAAESGVKVAEGALLPSASVNLQVNQQYDSFLGYPGTKQFALQVNGQLNIPLYQGGGEYSSIRQAKEQLGQVRAHASAQRSAARAAVVQAFSQFTTAKASIAYAQVAVNSAEAALKGVRDEAFFGQRTTLDVLNAQQALLNARVALVMAQRDRVVGSYAVLAATGLLSAAALNLQVAAYDPSRHFNQVKEKWIGVSTPDSD